MQLGSDVWDGRVLRRSGTFDRNGGRGMKPATKPRSVTPGVRSPSIAPDCLRRAYETRRRVRSRPSVCLHDMSSAELAWHRGPDTLAHSMASGSAARRRVK